MRDPRGANDDRAAKPEAAVRDLIAAASRARDAERWDDAVVATFGVTVLLGNGNGTFKDPVIFEDEPQHQLQPFTVTIGDFNGDGKPDIAAVGGTPDLLIMINNGTTPLGFTSVVGSPDAAGNTAVVGDFNRDGKLDLALAPSFLFFSPVPSPGFVQVLLGNNDGTFTLTQTLPTAGEGSTGEGSSFIAVADLDSDGTPDLVVSNYQSNDVSVLLGNGDPLATFQPALTFPAGEGPSPVAIADIDGDGRLDIVVTNSLVLFQPEGGTEVKAISGGK